MSTMVVEEIRSVSTQLLHESKISRPEKVLQDVDPNILAHVVARSRAAGNDAFQRQRYRGAFQLLYPFLSHL